MEPIFSCSVKGDCSGSMDADMTRDIRTINEQPSIQFFNKKDDANQMLGMPV